MTKKAENVTVESVPVVLTKPATKALTKAMAFTKDTYSSEAEGYFNAIQIVAKELSKDDLAEGLKTVNDLFEEIADKYGSLKNDGPVIAGRIRTNKTRSKHGIIMLVKHGSKAKTLGALEAAWQKKYGKANEKGASLLDLLVEFAAADATLSKKKERIAALDSFLSDTRIKSLVKRATK